MFCVAQVAAACASEDPAFRALAEATIRALAHELDEDRVRFEADDNSVVFSVISRLITRLLAVEAERDSLFTVGLRADLYCSRRRLIS